MRELPLITEASDNRFSRRAEPTGTAATPAQRPTSPRVPRQAHPQMARL